MAKLAEAFGGNPYLSDLWIEYLGNNRDIPFHEDEDDEEVKAFPRFSTADFMAPVELCDGPGWEPYGTHSYTCGRCEECIASLQEEHGLVCELDSFLANVESGDYETYNRGRYPEWDKANGNGRTA